jgi:sarcosine oxidase
MPSSPTYDVIVAGLGAMGSATAYQLARRGRRVLGLDRFTPPHTRGSTHGHTRIIRTAYWDDPSYVPLVGRAYESWRELEAASGQRLLFPAGALYLGGTDSALVAGARTSVQLHGIPYEELSAAGVIRHAPALQPTPDTVAIWEPEAGLVLPELAVTSFLSLAARSGADIHVEEPLLQWTPTGDGVAVTTPRGTYHADRLVLAVGPWMSQLVPDLGVALTVERQVMHWFRPKATVPGLAPDRVPSFMWEYEPGHIWYSTPDMGDGLKAGIHHDGDTTAPDTVQRDVSDSDIARVSSLIEQFIPDANPAPVASAVCLYTDTPDGHFVIDSHPRHPAVLIASPCSGHGFKFAPLIGEIMADLAVDGHTSIDLSLFRIARSGRPLPTAH